MNKELIDKLVRKISKSNTNLYEIAKAFNILIIECDLDSDGGFYFYYQKRKTILLNFKLSYYHKIIVLAHEIAHAFLHPYEQANFTIIGCMKNLKENEANYFACKLLDAIGFWDNEELCIYESEMSKADKGFIDTYKNYIKGVN